MDGTARDAPLVDIDTATGFGDSLPRLLALSEVAPVVRVPYAGGHVHVVADPGLVRRVLLDRRFSKQPRHAPDWLDDPLIRLATSNGMTALLLEEGAEHTRLRRLHMTVFGTREVRAREAAIAGIAQRLVDDLGGTREADLVAAVAYPLPVHVISEIIGLPPEVRATMRAASEDISFGSGATIGRGVQRLYETVGRLVHHERHRLLPGLITGLLDHGEREPGSVSDGEVVFWSAGLFIPGHESTASLLASALYRALLLPHDRRPRSRDQLGAFVEETLRHDPPFPLSTYRFPTHDVELGGILIPAGAPVLLSLAAANHDPATVERPDRFEPDRTAAHQSFGRGPHACIGASLARLEAVLLLEMFLTAYPRAHLADPGSEPVWHGDLAARRLSELRVRLW